MNRSETISRGMRDVLVGLLDHPPIRVSSRNDPPWRVSGATATRLVELRYCNRERVLLGKGRRLRLTERGRSLAERLR